MSLLLQIQSYLETLDGEQLETVKNDLIAIKEIFIPKESDDEVVQAQKGNQKYRDLTVWTIVTSVYSNLKN